MATGPLLTVLLPVRNAAADLPDYLASVASYADAVVAFDDGSTDDSVAILRAHPIVRVLRTSPVRDTYAGWDDAANRNVTLAAAAELDPRWLLSLDADERIEAAEGATLRRFLETDALPGLAYAFRCFEMRGPGVHLPAASWQTRLFAHEPGQRLTRRKLHFEPIPVSIPRSAYVLTTLRFQHWGGATVERRRVRYEKYRLTDPDCRFWPSYLAYLHDAETPVPWVERPADLPVLATTEVAERPVAETLTVLAPPDHPAFGQGGEAVEWVATTSARALLDRDLLERVGGSIVLALPRDLRPRDGALGTLLDDHAAGFALAAPAIDGPTGDGPLARQARRRYASTTRLPPGSVLGAPPVWGSYRRSLLLEVLSGTSPASWAALNAGLHRDGHLGVRSRAAFDAAVADGPWPTLAAGVAAVKHGRAAASAELERHRLAGRLLRPPRERSPRTIAAQPFLPDPAPPPWGRVERAGAVAELLRPTRGKLSLLLGEPQLVAVWDISCEDRRRFVMVSWSQGKGTVRWVAIPGDTEVELGDGRWLSLERAFPRDRPIRRFELHEAVAHPFSVHVDDWVRLEVGDDDLDASDFVRTIALPTLRAISSIETSIDRLSLALFLVASLRARRDELAPWPAGHHGGHVDAETAAAVGRFFAGHLVPDFGTMRDRVNHPPTGLRSAQLSIG